MLQSSAQIEHWFRIQRLNKNAPFYSSVDLRNAGFKLAPVDLNLFPGGFNNLNHDFFPLCVQALTSAVEKLCPEAQSLLLVPESHTRNTHYLQSLLALQNLLLQAGFDVRVGSMSSDVTEKTSLSLPDGQMLWLEPLQRKGNRLVLGGFDPCAVLLNNDLSAGIPSLLQGVEQTIIPPVHAGWAVRRKSHYFSAYRKIADQFCDTLRIDPWLIDPLFARCGQVDFQAGDGLDCLSTQVDALLQQIRAKYREYGVQHEPFVMIKADAGTYGMGIMTVKCAEDVRRLNRKQRNKMSVIKDGQKVHEVLIQEGVYTFETIQDAVAEPVVYMIDQFVVGGFYRIHTTRGRNENLNAVGMQFVPLSFEASCTSPDCEEDPDAPPNRFYAYGVVARLAMLAAALELGAEAI